MRRPFVLVLLVGLGAGLWLFFAREYPRRLGLDALSVPESSGAEPKNLPPASETAHTEYEIVTLVPRDTIAAIDAPQFVSGDAADAQYQDDELIIGLIINGDVRAYSIPFLSRHEIVNDVVGGIPVAVTW